MARILLLPWPLASHGMVMLKLARSLRAAGHETVFVNIGVDDPRYAQHGFRSVVILEALLPGGLLGFFARHAGRGFNSALRDAFPGYLAELEKALAALVVEFRPALAIMDRNLAYAALLFHRDHVRSLVLFTVLPLDWEPDIPPLMSRSLPPRTSWDRARNRARWVMALIQAQWMDHRNGTAKVYRDLVARTGFPVDGIKRRGQFGHEPELPQIIACPQCLEFSPSPKAYRHFVGPCIDLDRQEATFDWRPIKGDLKLAYCALGTRVYADSLDFLRRVRKAFRDLVEWQLVLAAGPLHSALMGDDPTGEGANVVLVADAPQLALLRRARLMLGHGGLGSVKECIYFGVPMVLFPAADDQFGNSARVRYHQLGAVGNMRRSTPDDIRALVRHVEASNEIASSLARMRRRFVEAEAQESVVDIVDDLLHVSA